MYCTFHYLGITWTMKGKTFKEDLGIINLGGCDIVLGNDFTKKYNPIKFDHEKNCVTIVKNGAKVILKGISKDRKLNLIMQLYREVFEERAYNQGSYFLSIYQYVYGFKRCGPLPHQVVTKVQVNV